MSWNLLMGMFPTNLNVSSAGPKVFWVSLSCVWRPQVYPIELFSGLLISINYSFWRCTVWRQLARQGDAHIHLTYSAKLFCQFFKFHFAHFVQATTAPCWPCQANWCPDRTLWRIYLFILKNSVIHFLNFVDLNLGNSSEPFKVNQVFPPCFFEVNLLYHRFSYPNFSNYVKTHFFHIHFEFLLAMTSWRFYLIWGLFVHWRRFDWFVDFS